MSSAYETPKATKRTGLGRGLGALIPQIDVEEVVTDARPLDVFFPKAKGEGATQRGGSARDLLAPRSKKSGVAKKQRKDEAQSPEGKKAGSTKPVSQTKVAPKAGQKENSEVTGSLESKGSKLFAAVLDEPNVSRETFEEGVYDDVNASYAEIPLHYIIPNTRQPRMVFDEDDLNELVASIKEVGVLQPVVVRKIDTSVAPNERMRELLEEKPDARFELIMGERRLRSSQRAGLETIPAIIRHTEDEDLLRDALLENLHRAQLNPLEEAAAYQQLMADFGATQDELSKKIARSRPQIANTLRLLKLPPVVQNKVAAGTISAGHARALLSLATEDEMQILADRIIAEGLSVRTTEELVRLGKIKGAQAPRKKGTTTNSPLALDAIALLEDLLETRVTVNEGKFKGKISIEYAGTADLQRLLDTLRQQIRK